MPEGPELHLASRFVNAVCKNRVFGGRIVKSEVSHKNPQVEWTQSAYTISATSRGKEVKLILTACDKSQLKSKVKKESKNGKDLLDSIKIIFRFGMSGQFKFTPVNEMHKHAHLNFFTKDEPKMVLSFVDVRRFGKWEINGDWGEERGPCVLFEYEKFRENVLSNLKNPAFNRPICEALLNQKFFNGIGNYLRAEILYRCGVPPFANARSVLEPLISKSAAKVKKEKPDILELCNILPTEVINLGGKGYNPEGGAADYSAFTEWLQCYYQPGMRNMVDSNKRTIWFHGEAGSMAPKEGRSRGMKKAAKKRKTDVPDNEVSTEEKATKKAKSTPKPAAVKRKKESTTRKIKKESSKKEIKKESKTEKEHKTFDIKVNIEPEMNGQLEVNDTLLSNTQRLTRAQLRALNNNGVVSTSKLTPRSNRSVRKTSTTANRRGKAGRTS